MIVSAAAGRSAERSVSFPEPPRGSSTPSPPSTMSLPGPPRNASLPRPPLSWSAPASPRSVSLPLEPTRRSSSVPPRTMSEPLPARMSSRPPSPQMRSAALPPVMRSSPGPPRARSCPKPRTIRSAPQPPRTWSSPAPPISTSAPEPPISQSLPLPPLSWSSPVPPRSASLADCPKSSSAPAPPLRWSAAAPPDRRSAPVPPYRRSAPRPPRSVSLPPRPNSVSRCEVPSTISLRELPCPWRTTRRSGRANAGAAASSSARVVHRAARTPLVSSGQRAPLMSNGRITVGTSSWADPGFVEEWYPPDLAARDRLAWYAERFDAVEVNSTFYALPQQGTVARWAQITPASFTFDVKLHRLLSRHAAPLESLPPELRHGARTGGRGRVILDAGLERAMAEATLRTVEPLVAAGKLTSFLLQLTPAFSPHDHRLDEIQPVINALAPIPVAVELRHRGWLGGKRLEDTLRWYEDANAAFVCVDMPQGDAPTMVPAVDAVTRDDLAYFRAHGRNAEGYLKGKSVAERFGYQYSGDEMQELAGRVRTLADLAGDVRTMFNNNRGADAPNSARQLKELLGQDPGPPAAPAQGTLV